MNNILVLLKTGTMKLILARRKKKKKSNKCKRTESIQKCTAKYWSGREMIPLCPSQVDSPWEYLLVKTTPASWKSSDDSYVPPE